MDRALVYLIQIWLAAVLLLAGSLTKSSTTTSSMQTAVAQALETPCSCKSAQIDNALGLLKCYGLRPSARLRIVQMSRRLVRDKNVLS